MATIEENVREICQELGQAIRQRRSRRVEDYLASIDTKSLSTELWLELIYTEFVARSECGERPDPKEYLERFPQLADDLEELFFLHQVVHASLEGNEPLGPLLLEEPLENYERQTPEELLSRAGEIASQDSEFQAETGQGTQTGFPPSTLQPPESEPPEKQIPLEGPEVPFPRCLGHYELLEEIGRGSTAVVYKARDLRLKRYVALKVVNRAAWDKAARERFLAEAEAAAALRHPHIVQIYEIGESDDSWYVAMEYLEGGSLADRPDKVWSPREAAKMVATLARAVQYAHEHHILHRDLKPANVLLDTDGTPKIVDFGLAKRLDEASPTGEDEELVGTPAYMAPEQTSNDLGQVGPATDVYALGAILYELLTGRPPFQGRNVIETLLHVRHQEPVAPSRFQPSIHRDLVTICLKCLEKEPHRRYPSAAALAEDLHRFLEGQVIWARPAGPLERAARWVRRHSWSVFTVAVAIASLGAAIAGLHWYSQRIKQIEADRQALSHLAEQQAQELRSQEDASRQERYVEALLRAEDLLFENPAQALAILEDTARCPEDLRDFTWRLLRSLCFEGRTTWTVAGSEEKWLRRLALAPDGQTLVWGAWDGSLILWDTKAQVVRETVPAHTDWIAAMAFAPSKKILATSAYDHTIHLWQWPDEPTAELRLLWEYRLSDNDVAWDLTFHPGGEFLVAATDHGIVVFRLWGNSGGEGENVRSRNPNPGGALTADPGKPKQRIPQDVRELPPGGKLVFAPPPLMGGGKRPVFLRDAPRAPGGGLFRSLAFSPGGNLLACGSANGRIALFSWPDLDVLHHLREFQEPVWSLAFSPDGNVLAGAAGGSIWLYNFTTQQARYLRDVHFHPIRCVQFSSDGRHLLTAAEDYTARVWDVKNLAQSHRLNAHMGYFVYGLFSPDSRMVYTASQGTLNLWDLQRQEVPFRLENGNRAVRAIAVSPDGRRLATVEGSPFRDATLSVWDLNTGTRLASAKQAGLSEDWLFFTGDGQWLVAVVRERQIQVRDAERFSTPRVVSSFTSPLTAMTLSPDGRLLVAGDRRGRLISWDTKTWLETEIRELPLPATYATALTFSPDGQHLLTGAANGQIILWDFRQRRQLATAFLQNGPVAALAVHPAGHQLAAVSRLIPAIHLFELPSLKPLKTWEETPGFITYLAYSADGQALLSATPAEAAAGKVELRIWNVATGRCHATFSDFAGPIVFVPGGSRFVTLDRARQLRFWPLHLQGAQQASVNARE